MGISLSYFLDYRQTKTQFESQQPPVPPKTANEFDIKNSDLNDCGGLSSTDLKKRWDDALKYKSLND